MNIDMPKAKEIADPIVKRLCQTHGAANVNPLLEPALHILQHGKIDRDETGGFFVTESETGESLMCDSGTCECAKFTEIRICAHHLATRIYSEMRSQGLIPDETPAAQPQQGQRAQERAQGVAPQQGQQRQQPRQGQQRGQQAQQSRQQPKPKEPEVVTSTALVIPEGAPPIDDMTKFHLAALPEKVTTTLLNRNDIMAPQLPPDIQPGQFIEGTMRSLRKLHEKGDLVKANPDTIIHALQEAIALGHLPGRDCHLVVFQGKMERWDDYRGLQRSLMRCPVVRDTFAEIVKHGDKFEHDLAAGGVSHKLPIGTSMRSTQPVLAYYAVIVFKDGYRRVKIMTKDEVQEHAESLPSWQNKKSAWHTHFHSMAKKTVLLALCRSAQQVQGAYHDDEAQFVEANPFEVADLPGMPGTTDEMISNMWGGPR